MVVGSLNHREFIDIHCQAADLTGYGLVLLGGSVFVACRGDTVMARRMCMDCNVLPHLFGYILFYGDLSCYLYKNNFGRSLNRCARLV